jgi:hypothetical protein
MTGSREFLAPMGSFVGIREEDVLSTKTEEIAVTRILEHILITFAILRYHLEIIPPRALWA